MNLISKKSDDNNIVNHKFKKLDFLNDEKTEESITIINLMKIILNYLKKIKNIII